jgi:hypothetical protein
VAPLVSDTKSVTLWDDKVTEAQSGSRELGWQSGASPCPAKPNFLLCLPIFFFWIYYFLGMASSIATVSYPAYITLLETKKSQSDRRRRMLASAQLSVPD